MNQFIAYCLRVALQLECIQSGSASSFGHQIINNIYTQNHFIVQNGQFHHKRIVDLERKSNASMIQVAMKLTYSILTLRFLKLRKTTRSNKMLNPSCWREFSRWNSASNNWSDIRWSKNTFLFMSQSAYWKRTWVLYRGSVNNSNRSIEQQ